MQAHMSEADLGLVTLPGNFKSDFCAVPLALVFDKAKVAVQNKPNDFLPGMNSVIFCLEKWASSGDPTPSQADIQMTKAIIDIAKPSASPCTTTSSSAEAGMRACKVMRLI